MKEEREQHRFSPCIVDVDLLAIIVGDGLSDQGGNWSEHHMMQPDVVPPSESRLCLQEDGPQGN